LLAKLIKGRNKVMTNFNEQIAVAELPTASYAESPGNTDQIAEALNRVAEDLRWSTVDQGPFGKVIPRGARVLIKPNFVMHENHGPWGIEPLVTHPSLIRAVVESVLRTDAAEVIVGDAPLQACDFDLLLAATGLDVWADRLMKADARFKGIRDLRRTTCAIVDGVRIASESLQPEDQFVLFDLADESLIEPITDERKSFRVTCYDPKLLANTHAPGRHQYLVSRHVIEADVVINMPKLKTHKKAGVTCALKNLVGINGNKEYLPHHRLGGSGGGGDCYPGNSLLKKASEKIADLRNTTTSHTMGKLWRGAAVQLDRLMRLSGDEVGIEGAWTGNDTVWRMCLDLNRILLYGKPDATMSSELQRTVIHLTDAVIAGHGDGPLSPQPLPLGLILAGNNAAAMDFVGALLLGYAPERISIVREAFKSFNYPLTAFEPDDVVLTGDIGQGNVKDVLRARGTKASIVYPAGWREAVASNNESIRPEIVREVCEIREAS
jgi:uncharacterized protein (DUF362 family)